MYLNILKVLKGTLNLPYNSLTFLQMFQIKSSALLPPVSVLEYDTESRELTVVMENLRFPNGIQLLPDEESVLVAETTMARIRR